MPGRIGVEACINCDAAQSVEAAVGAAYAGGASTVELCGAMHVDGLTPLTEQIIEARRAFRHRPGLLAMIRPRQGDFSYTREEILTMHHQIGSAAAAGADGIVFGALQKDSRCLALDVCRELIQTIRASHLKPSFHRAFDAAPDPLTALDQLVDLGVDRVLTSGIPWGHRGTACDGVDRLADTIERARGNIEVVIGGGVNPDSVAEILQNLPLGSEGISVHAFSGVQENGETTQGAVKRLVDAVDRRSSLMTCNPASALWRSMT